MNDTLKKQLFGHRDDKVPEAMEQVATHPFGTVLGAIGGALLGALIGLAAGEPDEQAAMLCRTYETGDAEARKLTRMLAELSVSGS